MKRRMDRRRKLKYICIAVAVGIATVATVGLNDDLSQEEKLLHKAIMMAAFSDGEGDTVAIEFSDGEPNIVVIPAEPRRVRQLEAWKALRKPRVVQRIRISKPAMSIKLRSELSEQTTYGIRSAIAALEQGDEVRISTIWFANRVSITVTATVPVLPGTMQILGGSDMIAFDGREFRDVPGY